MMTQHPLSSHDAYRADLERLPTLSRDEERELYRRMAEGDASARRRLAEGNLRLVMKVVQRYRGQRAVSQEDLIQEGNIGLLLAIDRFDPSIGTRFSTYAVFWITYQIQRALQRASHAVVIPVRKARLAEKAARELRRRQREGGAASFDAVASMLDVDPTELAALLAAREAAVSIEQGGGSGDDSDGWSGLDERLVGDPGDSAANLVMRRQVSERVRAAVAELPEREQQVIEVRFGLEADREGLEGGEERSLREAGEMVGLSQEGVRLIERRALERLRKRGTLLAVAEDVAATHAA